VKPILLFLLWLGGSATAVTVAWQGVGIVDDQVISPAPAAIARAADAPAEPAATPTAGLVLSAPTVTSALSEDSDGESLPAGADDGGAAEGDARSDDADAGGSNPSSDDDSTTSVPTGPAPQATSTPRPAATTPPAPVATAPAQAPTRPDPAPTARPQRPTPRPQPTATPRPPRPTATPAPQPTPVPQAPAQVLTFDLVGGTTSISFSAQGVEVLWATPRPGFTVRIDGGSTARVEFRSDEHDSRIDAWWDGGPQTSVREDD
jgi:hypothetical protein